MNNWFHCNKCLELGNKNLKYAFSSCGHIICAKCVKSSGMGRRGPCLICQKQNIQLVEVSRTMNPEVLFLFRPSSDVFAALFQKVTKISEFQNAHIQRLLKHHVEKSKKVDKYVRAAQMELAKRTQAEQALQAENNKAKEELEKTKQRERQLKRVLAQCDKQVQKHKREVQKCQKEVSQESEKEFQRELFRSRALLHTPPMYGHARQHRRGGPNGVSASLNGNTPLNHLCFENCVTSTPFVDQFAKLHATPYPGRPDYNFNTPNARLEDNLASGGPGFSDCPSTPALLMGSQKDVTLKDNYF